MGDTDADLLSIEDSIAIEVRINTSQLPNIEHEIINYVERNIIVSFKELKEVFKKYIGEDKLRRILRELTSKNVLKSISGGRYYMLRR